MMEGGEEYERGERESEEGRNGGEGTEMRRGNLSHFLTSGCIG